MTSDAARAATAAARARLDVMLTELGLAESRAQAQALVLTGQVRVQGETVRRPAQQVAAGQRLEVLQPPRYVSRGGEKLAPALDRFGVTVEGRVCADVGASTGGFTDVLLQRGATRVYAIDVGRGLLHWRLRQDARVVVMERVNARRLEPLPEAATLVTVDVSFIGLEAVLPAVVAATRPRELVVLFKPQFQVGREEVGKGGVVRDQTAVEGALQRFRDWSETVALDVLGVVPAAVRGPAGNQELLLHLGVRP
ncbi:MAG: TlyA family RNA methyltransferase [Candidatus Dormiibacterota bacterium]